MYVMYSVFIQYCFFFEYFEIFRPLSVLPRCQCVYTKQTDRIPALQQKRNIY